MTEALRLYLFEFEISSLREDTAQSSELTFTCIRLADLLLFPVHILTGSWVVSCSLLLFYFYVNRLDYCSSFFSHKPDWNPWVVEGCSYDLWTVAPLVMEYHWVGLHAGRTPLASGSTAHPLNHRCKKLFYVFYYFYKKAFFNVLYSSNVFYFLVTKFLNPTKPAKLLHKRLLSDGFNMGAAGNSLDEEP